MKRFLFCLLLLSSAAMADDKPVPNGILKAFKGPEGETIVMVEANDSKQMLVHFKGIGGEIEGQTRMYNFEDQGNGRKGVYYDKKKGSKSVRYYVLSARDGRWEFYNPVKHGPEIRISYSEKDSEKFKVEDVLSAYKPN